MNVYATLTVDDIEPVKELYDQGYGATFKIGDTYFPIISVDTETNEVEVGYPEQVTYH